MKHPSEIKWIEGDLPDVHTVNKNCSVLVFFVNNITKEEYEQCVRMSPHNLPYSPDHNGKLRRIEMCFSHKDDLNSLRWCDSSVMPIGYHEKVAYWAWLNKGTPTEKVDFKKEGF